jgi:hypothetical protein
VVVSTLPEGWHALAGEVSKGCLPALRDSAYNRHIHPLPTREWRFDKGDRQQMRRRLFILGSFLALILLPAARATDLNGKWKGDLNGPDGNALEINFDFKVDGEKLTGTVTNTYGEEQITEGIVKGDDISFIIMAGGGQFKLTYKGKVDGEDIKFHVIIGEMGEGDLVAKRVK